MFNWRERLLRGLARRFRIGEDILRHLSTFQALGERFEIKAPTEMIPVGARTLARALRTQAASQIRPQWLWPYWMERQLDPTDPAFTPRGHLPFLTNVTHRNWTAVGNPWSSWEAVVDPVGLVSTMPDGWSLDWWIGHAGDWILPSRAHGVRQRIMDAGARVSTTVRLPDEGLAVADVYPLQVDRAEYVAVEVTSDRPVTVAFAVRPYNAEGLAVVETIRLTPRAVLVDDHVGVVLPEPPERMAASTYHDGDCVTHVVSGTTVPFGPLRVHDEAGLAQAAISYPLQPGGRRRVLLPLPPPRVGSRAATRTVERAPTAPREPATGCDGRYDLERGLRTRLPDPRLQEAIDANQTYLLALHDPGSITPGPLTYHRFWFRDAAYQVSTLDRWGFHEEAADVLDTYPQRQQPDGFFYSQWREWDANGAAIFAIAEHYRLTADGAWLASMMPAVRRGADWIERKRHTRPRTRHPGLLPAGVSAEHLGPYDLYYWDNFWCLRGLRDAAHLADVMGDRNLANRWRMAADDYFTAIRASIARSTRDAPAPYLPAGPNRSIDAGIIGSLVACYPLELLAATDPLVANTLRMIIDRFTIGPAFYQAIAHTGLGTYLTIQLAYVELLAGDPMAWQRLRWLLDAASPTYTWPEAIHPRTGGGCMGDGHHGWAAADFLGFLRTMLVRDVPAGIRTVAVLSLLPPEWRGAPLEVHDAPTAGGSRLSYQLRWTDERPTLTWSWHGDPARLTAPGLDPDWWSTEPSGEQAFEPRLAVGTPGTPTSPR